MLFGISSAFYVNNVSSMNSYMANSKLFLTDNNYQSYQSSTSNYHFLLEKDW